MAADEHDGYCVPSMLHFMEQLEAGHCRHFDVYDQAAHFLEAVGCEKLRRRFECLYREPELANQVG